MTDNPRISTRVWITILILSGFNALSYMDRQIIALMAGPIKADLGISDFQLGLILGTAFSLLYATLGLVFGWAVDRGSRRLLVWAGVTLWSLTTMLSGAARSFLHLFTARVGVGAGEAILAPAAYSLISDILPAKRLSLGIGFFQIGSIIGAAAALIIGGNSLGLADHIAAHPLPLVGQVSGWQIVFVVVGLPGILLAPLAFLMKDVRRGQPKLASSLPLMPFLRRRRAYLATHFSGFGCIILLAYAAQTWVPTALIRTFGLSIESVGTILGGILVVGGVFGYVFAGLVGDRLWTMGRTDSAFRYAQVATIAIIICCPLGFMSHNLYFFLFGYAAQVVLVNQLGIAAAHLQIATPPPLRGRVSALFLMCAYIVGIMIGPPSVGFITDFVLRDETKVGHSIAIVYLIVGPLAILLFSLGRKYGRAAIEEMAAQSGSRAGVL